MKTKYFWVIWVCVALLVGMGLGYLAMPEKVKVETIASQCPEIPNIPQCPTLVCPVVKEVTCTKVIDKCPVCKDSTKDNEVIEKTLRTSLSCKDWLKREGLGYKPDLPFCWKPKNLIELNDLSNGCKIIYSDC